jgi:Holliday junction resolvase/DNA-directed RNA polymerase subunit RPC12/RpoP
MVAISAKMKRAEQGRQSLLGSNQNVLLAKGNVMADSQPNRVGRPSPTTPKSRRWGGGARVVDLTCDNPACGKKYQAYRSDAAKAKRHFCTRECQIACRSGADNPKWRGGVRSGLCIQCGNPFEDKSYTGQRFCSPQCRHKSLLKLLTEAEALAIIDAFRESGLTFADFAVSRDVSESALRIQLKRVVPDDLSAATESSRLKWHEVYRRGHNFELKVRRRLIELGYICMVSPRSMGPADLLAVKAGEILLVQCKHYGVLPKRERQPLLDLAVKAGGRPILAARRHGHIAFWELIPGRVRRKAVTL